MFFFTSKRVGQAQGPPQYALPLFLSSKTKIESVNDQSFPLFCPNFYGNNTFSVGSPNNAEGGEVLRN